MGYNLGTQTLSIICILLPSEGQLRPMFTYMLLGLCLLLPAASAIQHAFMKYPPSKFELPGTFEHVCVKRSLPPHDNVELIFARPPDLEKALTPKKVDRTHQPPPEVALDHSLRGGHWLRGGTRHFATVTVVPETSVYASIGQLLQNSSVNDVRFLGGTAFMMRTPCDVLADNYYNALTEEGPLLSRVLDSWRASEDHDESEQRTLLLTNLCRRRLGCCLDVCSNLSSARIEVEHVGVLSPRLLHSGGLLSLLRLLLSSFLPLAGCTRLTRAGRIALLLLRLSILEFSFLLLGIHCGNHVRMLPDNLPLAIRIFARQGLVYTTTPQSKTLAILPHTRFLSLSSLLRMQLAVITSALRVSALRAHAISPYPGHTAAFRCRRGAFLASSLACSVCLCN